MTREEYLARAIEANSQTPGGYSRPGWAMGPVGRTRDSGTIEMSNWRVVLGDMALAASMDVEDIDYFPRGTVLVVDPIPPLWIGSFSHWAGGWVEEIIFNPNHKALADTAFKWALALEAYPVADDMDLARLEAEEAEEYSYLEEGEGEV